MSLAIEIVYSFNAKNRASWSRNVIVPDNFTLTKLHYLISDLAHINGADIFFQFMDSNFNLLNSNAKIGCTARWHFNDITIKQAVAPGVCLDYRCHGVNNWLFNVYFTSHSTWSLHGKPYEVIGKTGRSIKQFKIA